MASHEPHPVHPDGVCQKGTQFVTCKSERGFVYVGSRIAAQGTPLQLIVCVCTQMMIRMKNNRNDLASAFQIMGSKATKHFGVRRLCDLIAVKTEEIFDFVDKVRPGLSQLDYPDCFLHMQPIMYTILPIFSGTARIAGVALGSPFLSVPCGLCAPLQVSTLFVLCVVVVFVLTLYKNAV